MKLENIRALYETYDKCKSECEFELDEPYTDAAMTKCISDRIRNGQEEYGIELCKQIDPNELAAIKSKQLGLLQNPEFKLFLQRIIKLLQFLYSVRIYSSKKNISTNAYDSEIILQISKIKILHDIKLDIFDFPGDGTHQLSYPTKFGEYLEIIKRVNESMKKRHTKDRVIATYMRDDFLKNYQDFLSDTQPWTRTLVTFINSLYTKFPEEMNSILNIRPNISIPKVDGAITKYKDEKFLTDKLLCYNEELFNKLVKEGNWPDGLISELKREPSESKCVKIIKIGDSPKKRRKMTSPKHKSKLTRAKTEPNLKRLSSKHRIRTKSKSKSKSPRRVKTRGGTYKNKKTKYKKLRKYTSRIK